MRCQAGIAPQIRATLDLFDPNNPTLATVLRGSGRHLLLVDRGLVRARRIVLTQLERWSERCGTPWLDTIHLRDVETAYATTVAALNEHRPDALVVVGGADATAMAEAATRAVPTRLIQVPSTIRAQAVPSAMADTILLDRGLLDTVSAEDWRAGFLDVLRIALVDDSALFYGMESYIARIVEQDIDVAGRLLERCARVASPRQAFLGDWFAASAGAMPAAIAVGIALDVSYAAELGLLHSEDRDRVLAVVDALGFSRSHPFLSSEDDLIAAARSQHRAQRALPCLAAIGCGVGARQVCTESLLRAARSLAPVMLVC